MKTSGEFQPIEMVLRVCTCTGTASESPGTETNSDMAGRLKHPFSC
jgi:hypothetical protein